MTNYREILRLPPLFGDLSHGALLVPPVFWGSPPLN